MGIDLRPAAHKVGAYTTQLQLHPHCVLQSLTEHLYFYSSSLHSTSLS